MGSNTFGYEPANLPSHIRQYDDYVAGRTVDYQPTPWEDFSKVNIDSMWTWIQSESDEKTRAMAEMWRRIGVLLEATRTNVERYATSLEQSWQSPAATEFLRRVGATLYSLDEWHRAAITNTRAINTVADEIASTQTRMRDIWQRYTVAAAEAERQREEEKNANLLEQFGQLFTEDPPTHEEVRREYTNLAKPVMKSLADTYTDSALSLDRGTTFKGPTAAQRDSSFSDSSGGSGGSGGTGGSVWSGGSGPKAPGIPSMPYPDASLPEHAGILPPAPAGPLPTAPVPPAAPVPPGGPAPLPGMPMPPAPGPRPPVIQNPPRPTPGTRLPAPPAEPVVRTPPPSRPNLLGTAQRSGIPAGPHASPTPGAPRHPNLLGTTARNGTPVPRPPTGTGVPTEPHTTAAPRLDGRHGGRSTGPLRPAGPATPSATTSANLAGRRKPDVAAPSAGTGTGRAGGRGSTSRILGGRTAPPTDIAPGRPHGPQLGDRSRLAEPSSAGNRPGERHLLGGERHRPSDDDDRWTADGPRPAVEAPASERPGDPGTGGRRAE